MATNAAGGREQPRRQPVRFVSFYLPQFHPIAENDEWWGRGFTEWTNVVRGRPLFRGHSQPHLPADLGFYDLRLPETRLAQAELAQRYGVDAFCYYHYWFGGRRVLHRPFDEVLRSGEPDHPFCLCWANENWTRVWTGGTNQVLLQQAYSAEDDLRHIRWLAGAFADRRYVRIDDRPVFLVYRASELPDAARTTDLWRTEAQRLGVGDLYLCAVQSFAADRTDPTALGFDAAVQFAPDFGNLGRPLRHDPVRRVARRYVHRSSPFRRNLVVDYGDVSRRALALPDPPYKRYPGVTPGFDNSSRRRGGGAVILADATPAAYERWLRGVVDRFQPFSRDENLVFVNAWNEWAEGNHLEPCDRWGRAYLEAHERVAAGLRRAAADVGEQIGSV